MAVLGFCKNGRVGDLRCRVSKEILRDRKIEYGNRYRESGRFYKNDENCLLSQSHPGARWASKGWTFNVRKYDVLVGFCWIDD